MRYLKLNEAEIKRTFDEWLKNPKAPREEEESVFYHFTFPAYSVNQIDEYRIDYYSDLVNYIDNTGGYIVRQIIDDLGLNMTGRELKRSDDLDEYFDQWLREIYNGRLDKFFEDYDLTEYDDLTSDEINLMMKDFNSCKLEQYIECPPEFDFVIKSIRMDNDMKIIVEVDHTLFEPEIEYIKDELTGQMSDGWGEGFSQRGVYDKKYGLTFYRFILLWWGNSPKERRYGDWEMKLEKITKGNENK